MQKVGTSSRHGFTIVELLIVIVIIGVLAALVIVAFNGVQQRALTSTLQNDLRNAAQSLERAKIDNGDVYPTNFPSDFKTDSKVSLNLAETGSVDTYCINGSIQGVSQAWKYDKTDGGLKAGSCSGQIIAGSDVGGSGTKINYVTSPNFTSGWALQKSTGTASASTRNGTSSDPAGNRSVLMIQNVASSPTWSYIGGGMNATGMTAGKSYIISYWGRIASGSTVNLGVAGVRDGNASNTVLPVGSANVGLTTSWQKFSATNAAQINGRTTSVFYIGVNPGNMNQNVTIELQDPRVEEQ